MSPELPLSFNQEHMLLRQELLKRTGHNVRGMFQQRAVFRVHGEVDPELLRGALSRLIERHTALRSTIAPRMRYSKPHWSIYLQNFARRGIFVPGMFAQRIHEAVQADVRVRSLEPSLKDPTEALQKAVEDDEAEPLDLSVAPAIRLTLMHSRDVNAVILATSHITHDAFAGELIAAELEVLYNALRAGQLPTLAPAKSHRDFAICEYRDLVSGRYRSHEEYWWNSWVKSLPVIVNGRDIPFGIKTHKPRPRPKSSSRTCVASMDDAHTIRLAARQARVTLYVLFRAILAVTLSRWTRKDAVAFWANFANRSTPSDFSMVSWCATTHLLYHRVSELGLLADLISDVAESLRVAMERQAVPLPAVWLRYGCDLTLRTDTRINFDATSSPFRGSSVRKTFEHLQLPNVVPAFDLDVRLSAGESLSLTARFNEERYDADGVQRMLEGMVRLAVTFAERPSIRIVDCHSILDCSIDDSRADDVRSDAS